MSFTIGPVPLKVFIENDRESVYKLPNYQRKDTWKEDRKFELAVSIFQGYPIGVLIVHVFNGENLLLDGRQRRKAIMEMVNNPTALYKWARKYIKGFKSKWSEKILEDKFWKSINRFFVQEEADYNNDNSEDDEENGDIIDKSVVEEKQRSRLNVLLDLILMVHRDTDKEWYTVFKFDFEKYGVTSRKYCSSQGVINSGDLRDFIVKYANTQGLKKIDKESFIKYCESNFEITEKNCGFEDEINTKWDEIKARIEALKKAEDIFRETDIGVIKLTDVDPFHARNIFSRVNRNGMQLTPEELLAASPFWNGRVYGIAKPIEDLVAQIYEQQEKEHHFTNRWDIAATLFQRIGDNLILKEDDNDRRKGNFIGFKLLSSIYEKGMSKKSLANLEMNKNIFKVPKNGDEDEDKDEDKKKKGENDYALDFLVSDIKSVLEILNDNSFFKHFLLGYRTIFDLLGLAPALEFIAIMVLSLRDKKRPAKGTKLAIQLQREALILFDKLAYEKLKGRWKNSVDVTLARHMDSWAERTRGPRNDKEWEKSDAEWKELIRQADAGELFPEPETDEEDSTDSEGKSRSNSHEQLLPLLYYFEALRGGFSPYNTKKDSYDIDHIIPQSELGTNRSAGGYNKNRLGNLELLPKTHNVSKGNKWLNQLPKETENTTRRAVAVASCIPISAFDRYSSLDHFAELMNNRLDVFYKVFGKRRKLFESAKLPEFGVLEIKVGEE